MPRRAEVPLHPEETFTPSVPLSQLLAALQSPRREENERALVLVRQMKSPGQRRQLRKRLIELLASKEYAAPVGKNEESAQTQAARGWFLSALASASEEMPDEATSAALMRHLDPAREPSDWVRFWALAGLHQVKHPELARRAKELLAKREPRNLVRNLAIVILAHQGDGGGAWEEQIRDVLRREVDRLQAKQEWRKSEVPATPAPVSSESSGASEATGALEATPPDRAEGAWEMTRALRIVPVSTSAIVNPLCDLVDLGEYTDSTFEALLTLGALKPQGPLGQRAAQALERYLASNPWPSHDNQREAGLESLGMLGTNAERSAALITEHLLDDSPSIVRAAARSLEQLLGTRRAVGRVMEACLEGRPLGASSQWGRALRWMDCKVVAETLDAAMATGTEEQQRWARDLLREVGGAIAFEKLHGRTAVMERYFDSLATLEEGLQEQLNTSLSEARVGFGIALLMDVLVFVAGLVLIGFSARMAFGKEDLQALALAFGGTGAVGVLYAVWIAKPRQQVRQAVDDLAHIKVVFLAYLRQLHQVDQAYTRRLLDSQTMQAPELEDFRRMVSLTLTEALAHFRIGVDRAVTAPRLELSREDTAARKPEAGPPPSEAPGEHERTVH